MVLAGSLFALAWRSRIIQLGDLGCHAAAGGVLRPWPGIHDCVLGVVDHRDDLGALEPVEDLERIAIPGFQPRLLDLLEELLVMTVVLHEPKHLIKPRAGNQHGPLPVVNHRSRRLDGRLGFVECMHAANVDCAPRALARFLPEFLPNARFGEPRVFLPGGEGFRL